MLVFSKDTKVLFNVCDLTGYSATFAYLCVEILFHINTLFLLSNLVIKF